MVSSAPGGAFNITRRLRANAARFPDRRALVYPANARALGVTTYASKSYREIDDESDAYAHGFAGLGITRGMKTILMVKPRPELYSIVFALLKMGAVPVVVDPGMGVKRMLHCYETVGAEAFIGIPIAHAVRVLNPRVFSTLKTVVTVGPRYFWGGASLDEVADRGRGPFPIADTTAADLMILNFTTGSTGPAKGVEYSHGMAESMLREVSRSYDSNGKDVTLATLPLFAIFDLLIGATSVLPPMDPTKPALVDPVKMIHAIRTFEATHMFGSPAFLHRVGTYARDNGITLPSLKQVISGGAPVGTSIIECFLAALSKEAHFDTTYGATEALPIASIDAREVMLETSALTREGKGTCVGVPTEGLAVRILRISDDPITTMTGDLEVPLGEVGEVTIAGDMVSPRYHLSPLANALMKIPDGERTWHRTGDLASLDAEGRLWFATRKSQRVVSAKETHFPVQWEGIFNAHPDVYRSALVGIGPRGDQKPVVCIELREGAGRGQIARIEKELSAMAAANPLTRSVFAILFHPSFPVDIRHNAKINREELEVWATRWLMNERGHDSPAKSAALRLVPILGWLFIAYGILFPLNPLFRALFYIDVFLSVVVHGLQLFAAVPAGKRKGYAVWWIVLCTFVFGATWWKRIEPIPLWPVRRAAR